MSFSFFTKEIVIPKCNFRFRQWTEADILGERYFQQFGTTRKRFRSMSCCIK